MTHTCLFTGEPLGPETHNEHTILRTLGGRIRSRFVASNSFNNLCSDKLDGALANAYQQLMIELGDLLSSEHRLARMPVMLEAPGKYEALAGGILTRVDVEVQGDLSKSDPVLVFGPDEVLLNPKKMTRQFNRRFVPTGSIRASETHRVSASFPTYDDQTQVAMMKCALLTFDHGLRDSTERVTRSDFLRDAIHRIAKYVHSDQPVAADLRRCMWGLQPQIVPQINQAFEAAFARRPRPFEHVLILSCDVAYRALTMTWSVFGQEPFMFVFKMREAVSATTYVMRNEVLKNGTASDGAVRIALPFDIPRRSLPLVPSDHPQFLNQAHLVAEIRVRMQNEARLFALRHDAMRVKRALHATTALEVAEMDAPGSLKQGMEKAFLAIYDANISRYREGHRVAETIRSLVAQRCMLISDVLIQREDRDARHVDWPVWIAAFRDVLEAIVEEVGPFTVEYDRRLARPEEYTE